MLKRTTAEVIKLAVIKHGDRYDYSKLIYKGAREPMKVICKLHGEFNPSFDNHVNKGRDCPVCAGNKKFTTSSFIEECNKVHNNFYNYSFTKYTTAHKKLIVTCPKHGNFKVEANSHRRGTICSKCSELNLITPEIKFWSMVNQNHIKTDYDYSKVKYVSGSSKIKIGCKIHGEFLQIAKIHAEGSKCPFCARNNFSLNLPSILYYVSIDNGTYYKIGVTSVTVKKRFINVDYKRMVIIKEWNFNNGIDAYLFEQQILKANARYKYKGNKLLRDGNTEIFTRDVLKLDI